MPNRLQCGNRRTLPQVCVAALLVGFLLYNPFLALISHSDGLTYQALARHRATVGASEMQHYSPVPAQSAQLDVLLSEVCTAVIVDNDVPAVHFSQPERLPQRPEHNSSLWFRPPPAV